jgi:transposase
VSKPQVIDDEEHERVFERVAAVDVAKASGTVCVRLPHPSRPGERQSHVTEKVPATTSAVRGLAAALAAAGVQKVTLESTSDYWRIWFYLLEEAGLDVQLVSASAARQLSGRPKTDKLDAQWLARLTENGLLRPSFVPPAPVRALRHYARTRAHLVQDRTRYYARLEKLLEDALIKVSSVVSALTTQSARDMIEALIGGQRDPVVLAGLARTRLRAKHGALVAALTGQFTSHHAEIARTLLDQIDFCDKKITRLTMLISEQLDGTGPDAPVLNAVARLDETTGISADLARSILSETGLDMTKFPGPDHLVSWIGLCPRTEQSGPRTKQGKNHGNAYLRGYLTQAAIAAARTDTFLGERYRRIARRRGPARAQVAVARSIAVIIWHLLADPTARYHDLGPGHHQARTDNDRKTRGHIRQLQALGYTVTLTPAA